MDPKVLLEKFYTQLSFNDYNSILIILHNIHKMNPRVEEDFLMEEAKLIYDIIKFNENLKENYLDYLKDKSFMIYQEIISNGFIL